MRGLSLCLMLAEPSHTSIVELFDPFSEDRGPVRARDVEQESPPLIGFVPLRTLGVLNFIMFNSSFQGLDLDA